MGNLFCKYNIVIYVKGIGIEDEERCIFKKIGNVIK